MTLVSLTRHCSISNRQKQLLTKGFNFFLGFARPQSANANGIVLARVSPPTLLGRPLLVRRLGVQLRLVWQKVRTQRHSGASFASNLRSSLAVHLVRAVHKVRLQTKEKQKSDKLKFTCGIKCVSFKDTKTNKCIVFTLRNKIKCYLM